MGAKNSLSLVPWLNADTMVGFPNVEFGINLGSSNLIQQLGH